MAINNYRTTLKETISTHLVDIRKNPLYKNSFFISSGRFSNVLIGFIFWIVAAQLYSIEEVGIATVLISSMSILISLSRLGFDFSLIRFIHINDKTKVLNTSFIVTTIASLVMGITYILGINIFTPSLLFLQRYNYTVIFLLFVIMNSLVLITGIGFTAIRKGDYFFFQNLILASRVPLLVPLAFLGSFGIFGSIGLAFIISALISLIYFRKFIHINFKIDTQFIKESFTFSFGNYASSIFTTTPSLVLPIIIFNLLGETEAARFYIAFAVGSLVLIIPNSLCASLFIEGSHGESLRKNVIIVFLIIYSFLIPAILFIYFFGEHLLGFFGKNYVEALKLLKLLVLSSLFSSILPIFVSIQNIRMNVKMVVTINFLMFILLIGFSYLFILRTGIVGVGYAWIVVYGILDLIIILIIKKIGWI